MPANNQIESAVDSLKKGNLIIFPTETVYALACAPDNSSAINKIFKLKSRKNEAVLSILLESVEMLRIYAEVSEAELALIKKFSPGPVTYILNAKPDTMLSNLLIKDGKIGVRIPDHTTALNILQTYGKPLVATSVNISGQKSAISAQEIESTIKENVSVIIDEGECKLKESSTVIRINDDSIEIIRRGSFASEIEEEWDSSHILGN